MTKASEESLKRAGYLITSKMGKMKYIPVFSSLFKTTKLKRKREKLVKQLTTDCLADVEVTKKIRRTEDLVKLSLDVQYIFSKREDIDVKKVQELRSAITELLIFPERRKSLLKSLKKEEKQQKAQPKQFCRVSKIGNPRDVLETIFHTCTKVWDMDRQQYHKNQQSTEFQAALKTLMSKDWLQNECILAGYVPVVKNDKLGYAGKIMARTCGSRHYDKYAYKKSLMKKIRREAHNYRYHSLKERMTRLQQSDVLLVNPEANICTKDGRIDEPGLQTKVFKAIYAPRPVLSETSNNFETVIRTSEKEFLLSDMKDISSTQIASYAKYNVAVKSFTKTSNIPTKLLPARFVTQMELSTLLDHPHIVRFIESFATTNEIYIIMKFAGQGNLHQLLKSSGCLMEETARIWAFQIAMALQYLHAAGIVHRNVKCSNILITSHYDALLTGFGSVKVRQPDFINFHTSESQNYRVGCTPYRAPEILRQKPYRLPPIDAWSLGVVLHRMLYDIFPFASRNKKHLLQQQTMKRWRIPEKRELNRCCQHLLRKLLEPSPSLRLKINQVVGHKWFDGLTFPTAHVKSLRAAPTLTRCSSKREEKPIKVVHNADTDLLDDLYMSLRRFHVKPKSKRRSMGFRKLPTYKRCYSKNKFTYDLVGAINSSLKKEPRVRRTTRRVRSKPVLYEKFISEDEIAEMQEKIEADLDKLKARQAEIRRLFEKDPVDEEPKATLVRVVKKIKDKTDRCKLRQEELSRKLAMFMPKVESEPRSILQMKNFGKPDKKHESNSKTNIVSITSIFGNDQGRHEISVSRLVTASSLNFLPSLGFAYLEASPSDSITKGLLPES